MNHQKSILMPKNEPKDNSEFNWDMLSEAYNKAYHPKKGDGYSGRSNMLSTLYSNQVKDNLHGALTAEYNLETLEQVAIAKNQDKGEQQSLMQEMAKGNFMGDHDMIKNRLYKIQCEDKERYAQ